MLKEAVTVTAEEYARIFALEQAKSYPVVDAFERRLGFAVDRARLESAARVLCCPVKASPPNWQHGRILYALARFYCSQGIGFVNVLDIGSAKGFSALCLEWALDDAGRLGQVVSVDVLPPEARVRRNTVAEVDGFKTLSEILEPWPEAKEIIFLEYTGVKWLTNTKNRERIHFAFVDGKHQFEVVKEEGTLLAARQQTGDLVMFDDVHMPQLARAVASLVGLYKLEYFALGTVNRAYAIGVRR